VTCISTRLIESEVALSLAYSLRPRGASADFGMFAALIERPHSVRQKGRDVCVSRPIMS
jgi:hypothetical protein